MAEGLNRAMLIGNLGSDPELRFTPNNRAKLQFRMATTESYVNQNNERQEVTHWHTVVLWGKRGEALSKILSKGSKVYVEGRIETRSYDDKDGVKRTATDIVCLNLILLGGRGEGGGPRPQGGGGGGGERRPAPSPGPREVGTPPAADDFPNDGFDTPPAGNDDDIPF